ncbi:MAG: methyltransferase domain-containing protein [Thermoplasmata archaeon]|nr:MAG: methyltransferase domain-containing protein [Thermoplasmata archaeon]MCD6171264.1 methyltransferase domain-containing protein [Thermoplasmata archaeon]
MPHNRSKDEFHDFIKKLESQSLETAEERHPIYIKAGLKDADLILDVGCGSGAVTRDVAAHTNGVVIALDDADDMAEIAKKVLEGMNVEILVGDAHSLPFEDNTFDVAICNLFLMWAKEPQKVVNEMARVVKKGGKVVASLEPDFGGKIHWPPYPGVDEIFAGKSIEHRGGDPYIGRKLRMLFVRAGLKTEVGLGNKRIWNCDEDKASYIRSRNFYWKVLKKEGLSDGEIKDWEKNYLKSLEEGIQFNFFPQFYAIGTKI